MTFSNEGSEPEHHRQDWVRPPHGVMPGCSCQRAALVRTDDVVLLLDGFLAYPNGVEFRLLGAIRPVGSVSPLSEIAAWSQSHRAAKTPDGQLTDDFMRLAIIFGDGTEWTNVGWRPVFGRDAPADRMVIERGGHGDDRSFENRWWIWPLPPPGPIAFVCSWPARGIDDARAVIDGDEIRACAADAEVLWD